MGAWHIDKACEKVAEDLLPAAHFRVYRDTVHPERTAPGRPALRGVTTSL